ncbi:MAG TPA: hypothetical protein VMF61_17235 [Candidatus Acidoferrales bacterium]|nr:hypothetical protein [Candidatus Acidoferrales bacterium]
MPTSVNAARATPFVLRLATFLVLAAVAWALALRFIYPGYIPPFVPFHSDEYQGVDLAHLGLGAGDLLGWPRPLAFLTFFLAGHLGLTGSLVFYTLLTLFDLALAMTIFERYFLRARIAWWIALAAFVFAIAGPGFYFSVGYDLEFSLAAFFGLWGICAWEARSPRPPACDGSLVLCAIFFTLSTLSKESFVPVLVLYGVAAAFFRGPLARPYRIALLVIPFVAVAIAFADDRIVGSPFVNLNAPSSQPYGISLSPASLVSTAGWYLQPLFNVGFVAFLLVCGWCAWLQRRAGLAAGIAVMAFSLYAPYLLLPSHLDVCYQWVAMPLLMLLVPLALVPAERAARSFWWQKTAAVACAAGAVLLFGASSAATPQAQYLLDQQRVNQRILAALDAEAPALRGAGNVLVVGLATPLHPWAHAAFLEKRLDFHGVWTVASQPDDYPIDVQPDARPIDYRRIVWSRFDRILIFDDDGDLVAADTPAQLRAAAARLGVLKQSNARIVAELRGNGLAGGSAASIYPSGVDPFDSDAVAAAHGLYPDTAAASCCFLARRASFTLRKPAGARTAVFTFYVPDFAPFARARQRVTFRFDGMPAGSAEVPVGAHDVPVAFPPSLVAKSAVTASLAMSIAFVPNRIGVSDDDRTLSVVLTQVAYR